MAELKRKILNRFVCLVFAAVLLVSAVIPASSLLLLQAAGEDATIVVSLDRNNFNVGDTFNVKVTYQSNIESGYLTWELTYDNSLVGHEGTSGKIIETEWFDDQNANTKNVTKSYSFKAKAVGKVSFSISATSYKLNPDTAGDSMNVLPIGASATITDVGSSDATLKSITIDGGTLVPAFSPNTMSYTVTVPFDVTALYVFPVTNDSRATHTIEGSEFLNVGTKTRTIIVTAQDGTVKKYVITVTRLAKPTVAPTQTPVVTVPGNSTQTIAPTETPPVTETPHDGTVVVDEIIYKIGMIDNTVALPEGFENATITYKGIDYKGARGISKDMVLVYLVSDTHKGLFVYIENTDEFYRYIDIHVKSGLYSLVKLFDDTVKLDFNITEITIGTETVEAYEISAENKEIYIVRAMNWNGEVGYYTYDTVEQTMQRYIGLKLPDGETDVPPTATADPVPTNFPSDDKSGEMNPKTQRVLIMLVVIACVICLTVSVFLLYFALKERKTCKIMTSTEKEDNSQ